MADISWLSPCNGAVFSAGDTIHVKWKTSQPTACPSFKLCLSSELTAPNTRRDQNSTASNECGTAIWPVVKEGKGFYLTSLSAPSHVKSHHTYVLRMEDDSGLMSESPGFSLTPSNASTSAPHTPDDPSLGASQAPFIARPKLSSPTHNISKADASGSTRSAITHSAKASSFAAASQAPFITPQEASSPPQNISTTDASGKTRSAATGSSSASSLPAASQLPFFVVHPQSPSPPRNMSAADASGRTHSVTTLSSTAASLPTSPPGHNARSSSNPAGNLLLGHKPPNVASFAVPVAVIASVLLIALVLGVRHRRKRANHRAVDAEKLSLSRQSSKSSFKSSGGIEDSMPDLPMDAPIPVFMPAELPPVQKKRSQRKAVPTSLTYTNSRPTARNLVRSSRALSIRSTYSQASAYLPRVVPASHGFFDEEREDLSHSVIADYAYPSPSPPSIERPPRARVSD